MVYIVKMNTVYETTLLQEVRERILAAFLILSRASQDLVSSPNLNEIEKAVKGGREWCYYKDEWTEVNDFCRVGAIEVEG